MALRKSRSPSLQLRKLIRQKTNGRCHVCGGPLGRKWQADHVRPRARGGESEYDNYLPCCSICNRAGWKSRSRVIRAILRYGVFAHKQVRGKSSFGREFLRRFRNDRQGSKRRAASQRQIRR